jgi:hypothetical protein
MKTLSSASNETAMATTVALDGGRLQKFLYF